MDERIDSFGYWLRRRRKALDLTQGALAEKVSCSAAAIKKIESEERRPSRALAERLAQHLGVPVPDRAAFLAAARHPQGSGLPKVDAAPVEMPDVPPATVPAAPATPFVGRAEHHAELIGLLDRAREGHGHVVLLQGEAGIGKSRLLQEVLLHAQRQGLPTLMANCYEIERAIAYQPVIDLASQACALVPAARLRLMAPVLLAEIAALVPALAQRVPGLPSLSTEFPEARQARLFQAVVQLLDAVAEGKGLLVAVDNIQWADDASLRFLHFCARQVGERPVLLACALRDEELEDNQELVALAASLRRAPHARQMLLPRLSLADVEALLQGLPDSLPGGPALAQRLLRESDGNPFFLWSILHALGDGGAAGADGASVPLPEELRDSVRARLARIPREDLALLELAAVLGRRFHFDTLLALSQASAEGFLHALDALVHRRLLRQEAEDGFLDFSHDKVREVVYGDIGAARRVLLHRLVAQRLERDAGGTGHERDGYLAEHHERGQVWPQAFRYFSLAAEHSLKLFAIRESLQWFDRAVALLQVHPDAAAPAQALALYESRGAARAQAGQTEGAVSDFQRVIDAARAAGAPEHARDVLIQLGMAYRRADSYERAVACLTEALAAARTAGDQRHVADCLYHLGTVAWSNGRNDLAMDHHQEAVEICERLRLEDIVAVQAFHGRGEAHFAHGRPAAAIACFSRSLDLARAIGDRSYESENLMMIGWACAGPMGLGDHKRALAHLDAALEIARSADLQWHLGPTLIGRAHALAGLGRAGEAWADLEQALPQLEALGLVRYQMMTHDAMGSLLLDAGDPAAAARHLERALLLAGSAGIRYWLPRLRAGLALARLRGGAGIDRMALQSALQDAQDHEEIWQVPRCLEALAEGALAEGDAAGALAHAGQLLAVAAEGGMQALRERAVQLRIAAQRALGQ